MGHQRLIFFSKPTTRVEGDPPMIHDPNDSTDGKLKAVRPGRKTDNATDDIVWAAYRKFSRGGCARDAMNECLAEDHANAKRRTLP